MGRGGVCFVQPFGPCLKAVAEASADHSMQRRRFISVPIFMWKDWQVYAINVAIVTGFVFTSDWSLCTHTHEPAERKLSARVHIDLNTGARARTHSRTHACTHAHTHTHTHKQTNNTLA